MTKKKKKLSATQLHILELMNDGWELGHSRGMYPGFWIQKNGIGKGGESKSISSATFHVLLDTKSIEKFKEGYPTDKYRISPSMKELLKSQP